MIVGGLGGDGVGSRGNEGGGRGSSDSFRGIAVCGGENIGIRGDDEVQVRSCWFL